MSERCHVGYHHFPPLNGHDVTWALFRRTHVAEQFSGIWRPAWSCCLSLPKGQLGLGVLELPELAIGGFVKVLCIFLAPRTKQIHRATWCVSSDVPSKYISGRIVPPFFDVTFWQLQEAKTRCHFGNWGTLPGEEGDVTVHVQVPASRAWCLAIAYLNDTQWLKCEMNGDTGDFVQCCASQTCAAPASV